MSACWFQIKLKYKFMPSMLPKTFLISANSQRQAVTKAITRAQKLGHMDSASRKHWELVSIKQITYQPKMI